MTRSYKPAVRLLAFFTALVTPLVMAVALSPSAMAATQVCRNVQYVSGVTYIRGCLTYTWSSTGATYRVNELRAWNPGGQGPGTITDVTLRGWDNSPFSTAFTADHSLVDDETVIQGDTGKQPSASVFQCIDWDVPGSPFGQRSLRISPAGNNSLEGSCADNGIPA